MQKAEDIAEGESPVAGCSIMKIHYAGNLITGFHHTSYRNI
jgi:hypothetical protein